MSNEGTRGDITVTMTMATEVVRNALVSTGMPEDLAAEGAEIVVNTEARGQSTHGLSIVPQYLRRLRAGEIDPSARPTVTSRSGATAVVDGAGALGHLAASLAARTAAELAASTGIGLAAVRHSNHAGAVGAYARMLADQKLIGIVAASSVPSMRAPGGTARVLGNNPFAIAYPTLGHPVVMDFAMSQVARRHISLAAAGDAPIPLGWALDQFGVPTTDAHEALEGSLEPFGGAKSSALSVAVGMLATGLSGAAMGPDLGDLRAGPRPGVDGLTVIAIDPSFIDSTEAVLTRASMSVNALRQDSHGLPDANVRLPGDRSELFYERAVTEGIRVDAELWSQLLAANQ